MYNLNLHSEQIAFLEILLFILGALLLIGAGSLVGKWLRPHRPHIEKLSSYESGEAPTGTAWAPFNARFYGIGLIFILLDIETILLFPWAMVWTNPTLNQATNGLWALHMALIGTSFIVVLAIGWIYAWKHGYLTWSQSPLTHSTLPTHIPKIYDEKINRHYATHTAPNQDVYVKEPANPISTLDQPT